jgi:hypothetical protein
MKKIDLKPSWLGEKPQTPLEEKMRDKKYDHHIFCNGSRGHPVGTPGVSCSCLGFLKDITLGNNSSFWKSTP